MMAKAMTLRLSKELADELEAVAKTEGVPVSEAVREAIAHHIDERRKDKQFRQRLKRMMAENQEILDRLAS